MKVANPVEEIGQGVLGCANRERGRPHLQPTRIPATATVGLLDREGRLGRQGRTPGLPLQPQRRHWPGVARPTTHNPSDNECDLGEERAG